MKYSSKDHKNRNRHKNRIINKEWASSVSLCLWHKPYHPHHLKVSPRGHLEGTAGIQYMHLNKQTNSASRVQFIVLVVFFVVFQFFSNTCWPIVKASRIRSFDVEDFVFWDSDWVTAVWVYLHGDAASCCDWGGCRGYQHRCRRHQEGQGSRSRGPGRGQTIDHQWRHNRSVLN